MRVLDPQREKRNLRTFGPFQRTEAIWQPGACLDSFRWHGTNASDPANPKIVHAFLPRESEGYIIKETWDVLGMRATRSDDTVLENAFVPDRYIARIVPAGAAGLDPFVLSLFAWARMGFGNIYYGLAKRALDQTVARSLR